MFGIGIGCGFPGSRFPGARESRSFSVPEFPGMKTTRFRRNREQLTAVAGPADPHCARATAHARRIWQQRASASWRRPRHGGPYPRPTQTVGRAPPLSTRSWRLLVLAVSLWMLIARSDSSRQLVRQPDTVTARGIDWNMAELLFEKAVAKLL